VPGFSQLTHLLASRMDPGDRELSDQDLRLIFGVQEITAGLRGEIADDLRAAGVEVLGLDPLLVRKAPPPVVDAPPAPPRAKTPFYVGAGVAGAVALLLALAPHGGAGAPPAVAPVPTLKLHARGTVTPGTKRTHAPTKDIRAVDIARSRQPQADLPCDSADIRSECESGAGTGSRARRGR
jgi:hypothetical protein